MKRQMKPGKAANTDRRITIMRKAQTHASEKYGIGGRLKTKRPNPITLPTAPWKEKQS